MIEIDKEKCVKCGLCANDCLTECIEFDEDGFPKMSHEERCLKCQHCLMVCPQGALSFNGKKPENSEETNYSDILSLIKSRRSVRKYKTEDVSTETIEKLKEMLPYIPTGCNSHALHFSIVTKREVMDEIRKKVNESLLNAMSKKILSPLVNQFKYYKDVLMKGEDIVFRNAPHIVVVSSPITAPCASTDPIIALSYFELYAQSLGLGTCWCGYGQICVKLFPEICEILEIPSGYTPQYVMLFGLPDVKYHRTPQPEKYTISEIDKVHTGCSCFWCKCKRFITNFLR